ncbi:MAG: tetratricopeptide repeat protein [Spirochaetales bacterium]|nr:tetratricopeptide repeat protein [Spirochaetales bacterium]
MTHEPTPKELFLKSLASFVHRFKVPLISVLGALLVGLIALGIIGEIRRNRLETSTIAIEAIQRDFERWKLESDSDAKKALESSIIANTEEIHSKWQGSYANQRAYFIRAELAYELSDWEAAVENWVLLAEKFPDSYLAPVSLMNSAAALEEMEDFTSAVKTYLKVAEEYSNRSPDEAKAFFSAGRVNEALGNQEAAIAHYNSLIDKFPSSDWTKLARDRIIYLQAKED